MSTALDMSLDDMIKNSRGNRERTRGGRAPRGRGGPRGSFNAGRMAAGRIPGGRMTGAVRRGPIPVNTRPSSIRAAGISGIEIGTKLYVSNLDYGVTNEDIRELFSEIGELKRYAVHFDKNGRPSGSAEVVYTRRSDAFAALKRYNNVLLDGKPMKIEIVGANAGMPISARVNVTGAHGRKKRTVVMTPGPGRGGGYALPMVNRGSGRNSRGGIRNGRGQPRGSGRGRGRGGPGRKKPIDKSVDELDKELDSYHADAMQSYFPMDISSFSQIDTFHWILDMNTFVGEAYDQVREMCIFLLNNFTLPPDKALAVYIQSPGSSFFFCGAVTVARPSAVLSLPWPEPGGELQLTADAVPLSAKIGVSVEDLASLPSLDVTAEKRIERLAMKVGENLFNFMQSFCGVDGSKLVVPMDILDRWFKKFQERAKRDPEYLKGFAL
ncbi:hypothetical protein GBA52_010759 [Prunus armeniaca]|nr:hypothetical protein GBA52_010759 [Prunus armeniaca]